MWVSGSLEPIRAYKGEDVRLELPGGTTVFDVKWLSVWDRARRLSLASVLVPEAVNVPPSSTATHPYKYPILQVFHLFSCLNDFCFKKNSLLFPLDLGNFS